MILKLPASNKHMAKSQFHTLANCSMIILLRCHSANDSVTKKPQNIDEVASPPCELRCFAVTSEIRLFPVPLATLTEALRITFDWRSSTFFRKLTARSRIACWRAYCMIYHSSTYDFVTTDVRNFHNWLVLCSESYIQIRLLISRWMSSNEFLMSATGTE